MRVFGERHPRARLTDAQVEEIRVLHEQRVATYQQIAERFGVSWHSVASICELRRRVDAFYCRT
jgi:Mn-dependent DtxR family transcriptional regulator